LGNSEQFVPELSEHDKKKVWFFLFSQNQSLTAIGFGDTSLCRKNLWINQRFLSSLFSLRSDDGDSKWESDYFKKYL